MESNDATARPLTWAEVRPIPADIEDPDMAKYPPDPPSPRTSTPVQFAPLRPASGPTSLVLTGVRIPFWDLVVLLVKISLAAIPAGIILAIVYAVLAGIVIGGMIHH